VNNFNTYTYSYTCSYNLSF